MRVTLWTLSAPWALVVSEYPYIIRSIARCKTTWAFQIFHSRRFPSLCLVPVRSGSTSFKILSKFLAFSWRIAIYDSQIFCLLFIKKNKKKSNHVASTTWYEEDGSVTGSEIWIDEFLWLEVISWLMNSTWKKKASMFVLNYRQLNG